MRQFPHVTAFAIQTRDGYIAHHHGHSTLDWRSESDATFFTDHLNNLGERGVVVVGNTTYKLVRGRLSKRNCIVFTRSVPTVQRVREKLLFLNPQEVSLSALLQGYEKVALLGGAEVYTYFFERDLIDEMYLTVEPVEFKDGLTLLNPPRDIKAKLQLDFSQPLNEQGTTLKHYLKIT